MAMEQVRDVEFCLRGPTRRLWLDPFSSTIHHAPKGQRIASGGEEIHRLQHGGFPAVVPTHEKVDAAEASHLKMRKAAVSFDCEGMDHRGGSGLANERRPSVSWHGYQVTNAGDSLVSPESSILMPSQAFPYSVQSTPNSRATSISTAVARTCS